MTMPVNRLFASVVVLVLCACARIVDAAESLTFIHLNDTYRVGAVEDGQSGGFGRVVTIVRELLAEGREVRILHGGDFLYPSLESRLWDGEQMVEAMNFLDELAPMYVVPGNHEFDTRDAGVIARRINESRFDWLADNVALATGDAAADARLARAFTFSAAGRTIGLFALTMHPDDGGNRRDYAPVEGNYVDTAERVIERFEAAGADLVVGLTHLGLADDLEIAALRDRHPAFRLIAGGHEHEPEFHPGDANTAMIVKGASNARTIWQIDVSFGEGGVTLEHERIEVNETIAADPEYQAIVDQWRARLLARMPFLAARLGTAAVPLDAREVAIRNEETAWGNFIADRMRTAFDRNSADLAFLNSGTVRIDDYIAGDITWEDIGRTFGFPSALRRLNLTGGEFRRLLEAGYRGQGASKGYFPQVSGFRVCVDRRLPDYSRIVSLQVPGREGWQEIEDELPYSLVMPDFLFGGGDGYRVPELRKQSASPAGSELKYLVLDAIVTATAEGRSVGAPVDPASPRFVELGAGRESCFP